MDSIEKRRFYLALTDSLPDLWVVRDIDETSYVGEDSIPSLPENDIIHLIYRQKVNGYHVKIEFDRKYDVMRGQEGYSVYTGHAILSFSKPCHAFQVYCEDFSDEQLKVWDLTNDEYYKKDKNSISPFQALCTALAATIGVGNIAGVAAAITAGGAGAVFWMWIAAFFGMSETLIGLTVVALGTSLPELVTSIVASRKKENGLAVGNVIGSNIFNILFIMGVSGTIHPIAVNFASVTDFLILLFVNLIALLLATKKSLGRTSGALMILCYIVFMTFAALR